jgi:cytochrome b561
LLVLDLIMETKNYSKLYRIMHWLIAFSMMALLATIFLRLTWMNKNNVADIIKEYLSTTDQSLNDDQLIQLAKKIRQPMWVWHIYIGYFLVGLFTIRITLPFFGEMSWQNPLKKGLTSKQRFQFWTKNLFKTISHNALANSLFNDGVISYYFSKLMPQSIQFNLDE